MCMTTYANMLEHRFEETNKKSRWGYQIAFWLPSLCALAGARNTLFSLKAFDRAKRTIQRSVPPEERVVKVISY